MSNRIYFEPYPEKDGITDVKIADDYAVTVIGVDGNLPDSDVELFDTLRKLSEIFQNETAIGIFSFIEENQKGVYIRGTYYDYNEIKEVFADDGESVVSVQPKSKKQLLTLAVDLLSAFGESDLCDDYQQQEGFSDEQFDEMINLIKDFAATQD